MLAELMSLRPPAHPGRTGRYSYVDAAYEVQRWTSAQRGRKKQIAGALGLDVTGIAPRLRGMKAKFTISAFGVIADEAGAPPGWPFIQWERAVELDPHYRGPKTLPRPARTAPTSDAALSED
jgi:hypothetical protein